MRVFETALLYTMFQNFGGRFMREYIQRYAIIIEKKIFSVFYYEDLSDSRICIFKEKYSSLQQGTHKIGF